MLGYHHPVALAKRYGTLDRISAGRLMLGVGVGSLREEFELLGVPFEDRGARADDTLPALRAALAGPTPSYKGDYVSFDGITIDPCAVQQQVPLLVGGRTLRSLRRAIRAPSLKRQGNLIPTAGQRWRPGTCRHVGSVVTVQPCPLSGSAATTSA